MERLTEIELFYDSIFEDSAVLNQELEVIGERLLDVRSSKSKAICQRETYPNILYIREALAKSDIQDSGQHRRDFKRVVRQLQFERVYLGLTKLDSEHQEVKFTAEVKVKSYMLMLLLNHAHVDLRSLLESTRQILNEELSFKMELSQHRP